MWLCQAKALPCDVSLEKTKTKQKSSCNLQACHLFCLDLNRRTKCVPFSASSPGDKDRKDESGEAVS